jgi:hypothetical protein
MWFRAARHRFVGRSVAALLAVLVCGSALDWGHIGGDDPDCDIVVNHHNHAAHRLSNAPASSPTSDHCYICHSLRLLHSAVTGRSERAVLRLGAVRRLDIDVLAVRDGLRIGIASRAPPSGRL